MLKTLIFEIIFSHFPPCLRVHSNNFKSPPLPIAIFRRLPFFGWPQNTDMAVTEPFQVLILLDSSCFVPTFIPLHLYPQTTHHERSHQLSANC